MCLSDGWGGLEMYPLRVAPHLARRDVESICVVKRGTRAHEVYARHFPETPATGASSRPTPSTVAVPCTSWNARGAWHVLKAARSTAPDVIHCHKSSDLASCRLAATACGAALVYTDHMGVGRSKHDPFHRWVYAGVDMVISISEEVRRRDEERMPLPASRIRRLYYGLDLERFRPVKDGEARREARSTMLGIDGARVDRLLVTMIGRFAEPKGQLVFCEAVRILEDEYADLPPYLCVLVGGHSKSEGADAGFAERVKRRIGELGLEELVLLPGHVDRVELVWGASDIAVVPSFCEAFGLVVIEAMAAGLPVIGSDSGGIPELIDDGRTGLLVEPRNPRELAEALATLLRSESLRSSMGGAAAEEVRRRFDMQRHIEGLLELYAEAAEHADETGERENT